MDSDSSLFVATSDGYRDRIRHPFHRHPLKLLSLVPDAYWSCYICRIGFIRERVWGCVVEECGFLAHKPCLNSLPKIVRLKHGSEVASWSLWPPSYADKGCVDCRRNINCYPYFLRSGDDRSEYMCIRCCLLRKHIGDDEESSLQVAKVIHHFFHPCALELTFSPSTICNACFLNHNHYSYHCKECHFFLDFECAQLPKLSHHVDDASQIHHFCHWHPLQPFPDEAIDGETLCQLCESSSSSSSSTTTSNPFYGCTQCQFYAHKSCIDVLPQKIILPLLDETVVLLTVPSYVCTICDRACSGLSFYSRDYDFCVKCTLQFGNDAGVFKSIHHWHLLRTRETDGVDKSRCFLCKKVCSGRNYECKKCSVYFHKLCAELPREIQHPIHPHHPLISTTLDTGSIKCKLCLETLNRKCYGCSICEFYLDFHCASLLSFIQYQGHPHLLSVEDNLSHDEALCNKCSETLPTDSPVLRCLECDFNLHLLCGPLPCQIKDPRHVHPLTFQEYYVEDNDMSDLFACHICEKKRDARLPVYLCTDGCFMTCEVKCVLREVVASLRGERGVMELDTMYPKVACNMITSDSCLEGITCASSGEYVATDEPVFSFKKLFLSSKFAPDSDTDRESNFDPGLSEEGIPDLRGHNSSRSYPYSLKDFKHYIINFEGIRYDYDDQKYIFSKHDGSYCGGDYLLPNTLHSVYNNFFEEHNIFGPRCNLNYDDKRAIVFLICSVLHDMRMIKVVDVSAERIAMWSDTLAEVQALYINDGVKLDSFFKHLTRIAEDHYLVRAVDIIETTFSELCNEKEELSETKERLIRELAETEIKIEDNKERLKSFRAYRYAGAHELKKEYYASLENKWRPCYEC